MSSSNIVYKVDDSLYLIQDEEDPRYLNLILNGEKIANSLKFTGSNRNFIRWVGEVDYPKSDDYYIGLPEIGPEDYPALIKDVLRYIDGELEEEIDRLNRYRRPLERALTLLQAKQV